jgi:hypothetical protein
MRAWLVLAAASIAACGAPQPPPPDQMAADVARLQAVVPLAEELRVTDFENLPYCRRVDYARGTFVVHAEDGCELTRPIDPVALADHSRLAEAIASTGVSIFRIRTVTYDPAGALESAWFAITDASVQDDWAYLYDRTGTVPKVDQPGRIDFTAIADGWWFVWSLDD